MSIVLFDHATVGMAELCRDHHKRDAAHGERAGIGVAQAVKVDRRIDPGCSTSRRERTLLFGFAPGPAIVSNEQSCAAGFSCRKLCEEVVPLLRQGDMARLSRFTDLDAHRTGI